jgi:sortase A
VSEGAGDAQPVTLPDATAAVAETTTTSAGSRRRGTRWRRVASWVFTAAGVGLLLWSLVVWQWNDPFTSLYTTWKQRGLETELRQLETSAQARVAPLPPSTTPEQAARRVRRQARALRAAAREGQAIGRIRIPELGVSMLMVDGTTSATLKTGPGLHRSTLMPGEGGLSYVAGHRTTYGAPFADIDSLRPGDEVVVEMPYAKLVYVVTGHQIVDDNDLSVLRPRARETIALQACHPRFFATQRYIVWARPVRVTTPDGTVAAPRLATSAPDDPA